MPRNFQSKKNSFGRRKERSTGASGKREKPEGRFGKPRGEGDSRPGRSSGGFNRDERSSRPWKKEGAGDKRYGKPRTEGGEGEQRFRKSSGEGFGAKRFSKPRTEGGYGEKRYGKREGGEGEQRYGKPPRREGGFGGKRYDKPRDGGERGDGEQRFSKPRREGGYPASTGGFKPRADRGDRPWKKGPSSEGEGFKPRGEKPWKKAGPAAEGSGEEKPFRKPTGAGKPFVKRADDDRPDRPKEERRKFSSERYYGKPYGPKDEKRPSRRKQDEEEQPSFVQARISRQREQLKDRFNPEEKPTDGLIRLNRFIANSGVCSRREADELIKMGLVSVNGKTITEMGHKVKLGDDVRYEGKKLSAEKPVYILLNKPKGFITTTEDPQERNTVMNLIAGACKERVYPVGRLDRNTTGLLLLTNDGELADKLTHPSYNIKKIYKAELDRPLTKNDFQKIVDGVHLEEGRAMVDDLAIVSEDGKTVGMELHIGWNHVVRRIFEALQYQVMKLDRVAYAGLDKKDLERGHWRHLRPQEVIRLKHFQ